MASRSFPGSGPKPGNARAVFVTDLEVFVQSIELKQATCMIGFGPATFFSKNETRHA